MATEKKLHPVRVEPWLKIRPSFRPFRSIWRAPLLEPSAIAARLGPSSELRSAQESRSRPRRAARAGTGLVIGGS